MILLLILVCPAGVWLYLFFSHSLFHFDQCRHFPGIPFSVLGRAEQGCVALASQLVCEEAALSKPDALLYLESPTFVKASGISGC